MDSDGKNHQPLDLKALHLYGLVSCFIASKLEEIQPIRMETVLQEAGHGKFQHAEIVEAERKIYEVLEYKILSETLIDRVFTLLDVALGLGNFQAIEASQRKELETMLSFVSKALLHDFKLCSLPLQDQALIVLVTALSHHAQTLQSRLADSPAKQPTKFWKNEGLNFSERMNQ